MLHLNIIKVKTPEEMGKAAVPVLVVQRSGGVQNKHRNI